MIRHLKSPTTVLSALAFALLLAIPSVFPPAAASAGALDGVTGPINEVTAPVGEVTAPVEEAVEEVVPPVTPPPVAEPPPVQVPEVQAPEAPVKPPPVRLPEAPVKVPDSPHGASLPDTGKVVETTKNTVDEATKTVTNAAGTVASAGKGATQKSQSTTAEVTGAAQTTTQAATAPVEKVFNTRSPANSAGSSTAAPGASTPTAGARDSTAENDAAGLPSGGGRADLAAGESTSAVLPGFPARLLRPFIYVWPAVALLAEGPLGDFVGRWSRSVLALFEENGTGSVRGEALQPAATGSPVSTSNPGDQPPFSWFAPAVEPFKWIASENALIVLLLFAAIGAAALAVLVLGRRELGLPIFRHGNRFPWRH